MKKTLADSLLSFFFYYTSLVTGWLIASFVFIYSPMREESISGTLAQSMRVYPFWIGTGFLFSALYWLLKKTAFVNRFSAFLARQVFLQTIFIILLLLDYVLYSLNWHFHVFELTIFLLTIALIMHWGSLLSTQPLPGWQHPTTYGSIVISTLLNGCALLILITPAADGETVLPYLILVLLLLELLILFARFRYLSIHSQATNGLARLLMSRHIFLFGIRIMVGIFMPLIFILYFYFLQGKAIEGVAILILVGTFLERYLFIKTSGESV